MSLFKKIIHSGLQEGDFYTKKRGILLTNYFCLVLSSCILLLFVLRRGLFGHIPGGLNAQLVSIGLIVFLLPILLNRLFLTTASRLFMSWGPVCFIWYVYLNNMYTFPDQIESGTYIGLRLFILSISFIPYLLFDKSKIWILFLGILPSLVSFLFFERIMNFTGISHSQLVFKSLEYPMMHVRAVVAYLILSGGCYAFQSVIVQNDEYNQKLLHELKEKSEEIEAQNEELMQSQEKLNEINLHLEDLVLQKTAMIHEQDQKLIQYAFANAHQVRAPVARLLGLVHLSKLETDLDYPWFFEKVEDSTLEIDLIIKGISKELETASQNPQYPSFT